MQKFFLVISFFLIPIILFAQSDDLEGKLKAQEEQLKEKSSQKKDSILISDYEIYYQDGTIKIPDTSLSIYKDYKFNFLRRDLFDLISFANTGHAYNKLSYDFKNNLKLPDIGATVKHYNYFEKEDIGYYKVATPFTEIFAKSTFEQGQILDFLVSVNLSPSYNFTFAQKGYKSLGKYQSTRARGNQLRFSSNFNSKNQLTYWRFHLTSQNIFNQENGGLPPDDIYFYEQAPNYFVLDDRGNQIINEDGSFEMIYYDGYLDRSRLGVWTFAENNLFSKRFFSDLKRVIFIDRINNDEILSINYRFTHEYKKLEYRDETSSPLFGDFEEGTVINDKLRYLKQENEILLFLKLNNIGDFKIGYNNILWKKNYNGEDDSDNNDNLEFKQSIVSAQWKKQINSINFDINLINSLGGDLTFKNYQLNINGTFLNNFNFNLGAVNFKRSPDLNYISNKSNYISYNWNNTNLKDQNTLNAHFDISFKDLIKISADYNKIDNYTFFVESTNQLNGDFLTKRLAEVNQKNSQIDYYKIRIDSKVDYRKFSLINTAMYQKTEQIVEINELATLNVPEWVSRNTLMYSTYLFNNSLFIQTGVTFNYFTKFYADYYNPLLSEFVTQGYKQIGEYPRYDFFLNAKIQQTRVFIKVEHLNNSISGYDYYSDPFNPYRDLSVRFGLVWNFFQ